MKVYQNGNWGVHRVVGNRTGIPSFSYLVYQYLGWGQRALYSDYECSDLGKAIQWVDKAAALDDAPTPSTPRAPQHPEGQEPNHDFAISAAAAVLLACVIVLFAYFIGSQL